MPPARIAVDEPAPAREMGSLPAGETRQPAIMQALERLGGQFLIRHFLIASTRPACFPITEFQPSREACRHGTDR